MATVRGRLLWHSISRSRKLAALSCHGARLLYTWMIPHTDNLGRLDGEPDAVRSLVVPLLRDSISTRDVERWLGEMRDCGLIVWYEVDGLRYVEVVGHHDRQRLVGNMRRTSDYPPPPDTQTELIPRANAVPPEVEVEGEGEEKTGDSPALVSPPADYPMRLNGKDGIYAPTVAQVAKWAALYRAVNVPAELSKMVAWFDANPTRRKTRRGIEKCIVGWLGREQDKGRSSYDTSQSARGNGGAVRRVEESGPLPPAPTPEQLKRNAAAARTLVAKIAAEKGLPR